MQGVKVNTTPPPVPPLFFCFFSVRGCQCFEPQSLGCLLLFSASWLSSKDLLVMLQFSYVLLNFSGLSWDDLWQEVFIFPFLFGFVFVFVFVSELSRDTLWWKGGGWLAAGGKRWRDGWGGVRSLLLGVLGSSNSSSHLLQLCHLEKPGTIRKKTNISIDKYIGGWLGWSSEPPTRSPRIL